MRVFSCSSRRSRSQSPQLHFWPNDRNRNMVIVSAAAHSSTGATHVRASEMHDRSQADLHTWLRYAVSGTLLVLHLDGEEQLDCARRIAWFVETCRRFDINVDVKSDAMTRDAFELLHALGAESVVIDATIGHDRRARAVVRKVHALVRTLALKVAASFVTAGR